MALQLGRALASDFAWTCHVSKQKGKKERLTRESCKLSSNSVLSRLSSSGVSQKLPSKGVKGECPAGMSSNQERMSSKSVKKERLARVSCQERPTRVANESDQQGCPARASGKGVLTKEE